MKSREKQALVRVLDRAYDEARDYLLGPHAALDYGDELASVLRQNAADFRKVAQLARELELPSTNGGDLCAKEWDNLAAHLEQAARREDRELKRFRIEPIRGKH